MKRTFARLTIASAMALAVTVFTPPVGMSGASALSSAERCLKAISAGLFGGVASAAECDTPVPGSVTNETGAIKGAPLTDLVDAYTGVSGVDYQHQLFSTLSSKPQACSHYRNNQVVTNEKWLVLVQTAARFDGQPAPFAVGTYTIGVGDTDPEGTLRTADATYSPKGKSCATGGQQNATAGTITYTTVTDTLVEGTYDLWFGGDHVTGSFSAPHCNLCAPRPTRQTCVKG